MLHIVIALCAGLLTLKSLHVESNEVFLLIVFVQDACRSAGASGLLPGDRHTHGSAHCEGGPTGGQL
jgi:hypothetical protein